MEEKGQEMEKLQLDLKDKEVENKIAGKKGDQLVSIGLFGWWDGTGRDGTQLYKFV